MLELEKKFVCGWVVVGGWCINLFQCSPLVQTRPLALDSDWDQAEQQFNTIWLRLTPVLA